MTHQENFKRVETAHETPRPKTRAPKPNRAQRRKLEKSMKRKAKRDPKMRQLLGALEQEKK